MKKLAMLDSRFWKKYFKVYDLLNELMPYQELLNRIADEARIIKGDVVLDAGAGTGNLGVLLEKKGAKIIAFDSSKEGLEIHKTKTPNEEFVIGNLEDPLLFDDNRFDKICSNNAIYAIAKGKRDQLFSEFYRVLKPGGRIVVSNITKGFKPFKIYSAHISQSRREHGIIYTVGKVLKFVMPTIKIFYYNSLIKREHKSGSFDFFEDDEQRILLNAAGFKDISENVRIYADQAILNSANK